jgi:hypothetical protein
MADPEHLEILEEGSEAWNEWRSKHPETVPDLSGINILNANLSLTDFSFANLSGGDLTGADLSHSILTDTNLSGTDLTFANLSYAFLDGANFADVKLGYTVFGDNDLSQVKGLDAVVHLTRSSIGMDTIIRSYGEIPELFLRGCGLPEPLIAQIPALIATLEPIEFYSCFISYSSKDQEFADRLHADLQNKGVRCWFAPEDLKIGDRFRDRIDESIRLHDKLLLILSENSVSSQWVGDEVEAAFERERRECRTVLFPLRIDDAAMDSDKAWAATIRRTRHVGDFTGWKEHDSYRRAFDRLLRDLRAGA